MTTRAEAEAAILDRIKSLSRLETESNARQIEHLANAYAALNDTSTRARFQNRPPRPGDTR